MNCISYLLEQLVPSGPEQEGFAESPTRTRTRRLPNSGTQVARTNGFSQTEFKLIVQVVYEDQKYEEFLPSLERKKEERK